MTGRLEGKVAIVTGAGRGLGKAIAKRCAAEGAKVAAVSLTPANAQHAADEIAAAGGAALAIPCDIRDASQIRAAVARTVEAFGTLDILVNAADDHSFDLTPVLAVTPEDIQRRMETGPIAALRFMQACYPHLENRDGRVINFATAVAIAGMPGLAPFAMAKEAVRTLTRVAAREWGGKGITVNAICPLAATDGLMQMSDKIQAATGKPPPRPEIPVGRMGSAEDDIAPLAVFLASPEAGYLTGYTFMADGGARIDAAR